MEAEVKKDDLMGVYKEIAEILDVDSAYKVFKELRGQQICFPQRFYDSKKVKDIVRSEYTGNNAKELARKYGYSERRIRQFLSKDNLNPQNE
ncbi:MAG: Mor transcription activator family protein [Clostridiales bacterium]|nr:Mor transcription activator family protein [Clostridiales bacterium]